MKPVTLSIIIGVQHAQANILEIVRAMRPAAHPEVEFIFCHTSADADVPALVGDGDQVRTIRSPEGSLIPHLWREGIMAARGERVCTTTAHCVPTPDWVDALLAADLRQIAAAGGTIENDPHANAIGRAIFLQRYAAFAPPQAKCEVYDLAADNALYRRSNLQRYPDLLQRGFWEPSFHKRFQAEGLRIAIDPSLRVIHRNRYSARQYMRQRLAHGREFGLTRAMAHNFPRRLLLLLLAPAVFPLMLSRIVCQALGKPALRKQLTTAWLWLPAFVLAWVAGEAWGYQTSLWIRNRASREGQP
jgi:Glycosyl transferase family 2